MRKEMLNLQSGSIKENAMLSRKLETALREKRELSKQLAIAQKENRAAKQQLEELLTERASFLQKLETATKQLKANNKTKKMAFMKLEESQTVIVKLKQHLEEALKEKDLMERRTVCLEEQLDRLKMEMEISVIKTSSSEEPSKRDSNKEHDVEQGTNESSDDKLLNYKVITQK